MSYQIQLKLSIESGILCEKSSSTYRPRPPFYSTPLYRTQLHQEKGISRGVSPWTSREGSFFVVFFFCFLPRDSGIGQKSRAGDGIELSRDGPTRKGDRDGESSYLPNFDNEQPGIHSFNARETNKWNPKKRKSIWTPLYFRPYQIFKCRGQLKSISKEWAHVVRAKVKWPSHHQRRLMRPLTLVVAHA